METQDVDLAEYKKGLVPETVLSELAGHGPKDLVPGYYFGYLWASMVFPSSVTLFSQFEIIVKATRNWLYRSEGQRSSEGFMFEVNAIIQRSVATATKQNSLARRGRYLGLMSINRYGFNGPDVVLETGMATITLHSRGESPGDAARKCVVERNAQEFFTQLELDVKEFDQVVSVSVGAGTLGKAASIIKEEMDSFRAMVCFTDLPIFSLLRKGAYPLSGATLGPAIILLDETESRCPVDGWVDNPSYSYRCRSVTREPLKPKDVKKIKGRLQAIDASPWRPEIKTSLSLYLSAMEALDPTTSLSLLWLAFESLLPCRADSVIHDNEQRIKVASTMFEDTAYASISLRLACSVKGSVVHTNYGNSFGESILISMEHIYKRVFLSMLKLGRMFKTIDEAAEYMLLEKSDGVVASLRSESKRTALLADRVESYLERKNDG